MHGQPALPADFSRLPYADPQATKGGHLALAYQGTWAQIGRPDRRRNRYPLASAEGFFNTIDVKPSLRSRWRLGK
jgi:ABC-type oligopeptide transport system substrate-binding subunit